MLVACDDDGNPQRPARHGVSIVTFAHLAASNADQSNSIEYPPTRLPRWSGAWLVGGDWLDQFLKGADTVESCKSRHEQQVEPRSTPTRSVSRATYKHLRRRRD
jgi:hypothetical protein